MFVAPRTSVVAPDLIRYPGPLMTPFCVRVADGFNTPPFVPKTMGCAEVMATVVFNVPPFKVIWLVALPTPVVAEMSMNPALIVVPPV